MAGRRYEGSAATFDTVAELYELARPRYPSELFDDVAALAGLGRGPARVLEIGAGTGQATRGLLARGWDVVALEPGPELARVARRVLARQGDVDQGDVDVVVATFEEWPGGGTPFDLVFAATSWHWLDASVAYQKAAALLRPRGHLAIVATEHVLPAAGGDAFFREVEEAYDDVGLGDGQGGPKPPEAIRTPDVLGRPVPRPPRHVLRPHRRHAPAAGASLRRRPPPDRGPSRRVGPQALPDDAAAGARPGLTPDVAAPRTFTPRSSPPTLLG